MSALRIAVLAVAFVSIKAQGPAANQQGVAVAPTGVAATGGQPTGGPMMTGGPMVSTPTGGPMMTGGPMVSTPTGAPTGGPTMNTQGGYYTMPQNAYVNPYSNPYANSFGYPSTSYGYPSSYDQSTGYQYGNQGSYMGGYPPYGAATRGNRQSQQSQFNNILPLLAFGGDKMRQMAMIQSFARGGQGGGQSFMPMYAAMGGLGDAAQTAALLGGMGGQMGRSGSLPMLAVLNGNENMLPWVFAGMGGQGQGQGTGRQSGYQGQGGYQSQRQSQAMGFNNPAFQYMMLGGNL